MSTVGASIVTYPNPHLAVPTPVRVLVDRALAIGASGALSVVGISRTARHCHLPLFALLVADASAPIVHHRPLRKAFLRRCLNDSPKVRTTQASLSGHRLSGGFRSD